MGRGGCPQGQPGPAGIGYPGQPVSGHNPGQATAQGQPPAQVPEQRLPLEGVLSGQGAPGYDIFMADHQLQARIILSYFNEGRILQVDPPAGQARQGVEQGRPIRFIAGLLSLRGGQGKIAIFGPEA